MLNVVVLCNVSALLVCILCQSVHPSNHHYIGFDFKENHLLIVIAPGQEQKILIVSFFDSVYGTITFINDI